jgi:uncharacterized phiE125 gp8 family phage protein
MWYPATVAAPTTEPLTLDQAKAHLRVDGADDDEVISALIASARAHLEKACGVRFASRTGVVMKCDAFADLARLPEVPVTSVASVTYVDADGETQTLSTSVYELRADGIEAAIVLKSGQSWPATQMGSRITVTATVGYSLAPEEIVLAMKMLAAHFNDNRSAVAVGESVAEYPFAVNALICNQRRGV